MSHSYVDHLTLWLCRQRQELERIRRLAVIQEIIYGMERAQPGNPMIERLRCHDVTQPLRLTCVETEAVRPFLRYRLVL